jgi:hypothetical protein
VLDRRCSIAVRVATCIECRAAVAHPDLEAVKALLAAISAAPDLSITNRGWVAQVKLPPWSHGISTSPIGTNPGSSIRLSKTSGNRSIVGQRSSTALKCGRLRRRTGLVLVGAASPGEVVP